MLFLLLILWPVAEIFVAIEIAQAIGVLPMLLLLVAGWPVGLWALHSAGAGLPGRRLSEGRGREEESR